MKFRRVVLPRSREPLHVLRSGRLSLDVRAESAVLDGVRQPARFGCWMYYLPERQAKLFHAADGRIDCTHAARPDEETLGQPDRPLGRYRLDDWRRALTTPLERRLAEIWLVSVRLWKAGLGPQPLGVCFVRHVERDGRALGPTCGLLTQNVFQLPRKLNCTLAHVRQAGVVPDQILSCVRQQVRGYVVDLCSVVGCVPAGADDDVARLETLFREPPPELQLRQALEETMR